MALTDFEKIIRNIDFGTGNDAVNSRWTDTGLHGNHLPWTSGTPTVATIGGVAAWSANADGSVYSEYQAPEGSYSVIMPIYHDSSGLPYYWWKGYRNFAAGDHDGTTNTFASWADGDSLYLRVASTILQWQDAGGFVSCSDTVTKGQWNIFTFAVDANNSKMIFQLNDDAPVETSAASWSTMRLRVGDRVRVGHVTSGAALTGTFGYGGLTEISGNIFTEQSARKDTEIAALKAKYSIT